MSEDPAGRRRRVLLAAWLLGGLALAFYLAFFVINVIRN